jgi:[glutamine synthetase] adenylyltransferase / [glutamine synthetase]-adenylyl-L-tyrosine phosphorylase
MAQALIERLSRAPVLDDASMASSRLNDILPECPETIRRRLSEAQSLPSLLLRAFADHSPFLWGLVRRDPARLADLMQRDPRSVMDDLIADLMQIAMGDDAAQLMRCLRRARGDAALVIALADCGGVWDLVDVTQALSDFADAAVRAALIFALREADGGAIRLIDPTNPQHECGIVILALGKHGAGELNYSSDIDLVVLFDPDAPALRDHGEPATVVVRIRRRMAMSRALICGFAPIPARRLSRSACQQPSPITRRLARTGSARR